MARALTAVTKSTPTYLFRITDADSSGVDVSKMSIMLVLKFMVTENNEEVEDRYYVLGESAETNFFDLPEGKVWIGKNYCLSHGDGIFSVTIPFWRLAFVPTSCAYQVFLYSTEYLSNPNSYIRGEIGSEETTLVPGLIQLHNIMIDSGTISFEESMFPIDESKDRAPGLNNLE